MKKKIVISSRDFTYLIDSNSGSIIQRFNFGSNTKPLILDEDVYQGDLFRAREERINSKELMQTIDKINSSGVGKITFASQGITKSWSMRRLLKSPRYLTP